MFVLNKLYRYIKGKKECEVLANELIENHDLEYEIYELWDVCMLNNMYVGFISTHFVDKRYSKHIIVLFLNGVSYRFKCILGWYILDTSYAIYKNAECIFEHHDDWDPEDIDKVYPLHELTRYL